MCILFTICLSPIRQNTSIPSNLHEQALYFQVGNRGWENTRIHDEPVPRGSGLKWLCSTGTEQKLENCFCWDNNRGAPLSLGKGLKYDMLLEKQELTLTVMSTSCLSQGIILFWRDMNKILTLLDTSFYLKIICSESI